MGVTVGTMAVAVVRVVREVMEERVEVHLGRVMQGVAIVEGVAKAVVALVVVRVAQEDRKEV